MVLKFPSNLLLIFSFTANRNYAELKDKSNYIKHITSHKRPSGQLLRVNRLRDKIKCVYIARLIVINICVCVCVFVCVY